MPDGSAVPRRDPPSYELLRAAADFLTLHHSEERLGDPAHRIAAIRTEIAGTGTYRHTTEELVFGARVAWRNANRCIGRLYWRSLRVRDLRGVRDGHDVAEASADHLREASRDGRIRALISVFAPDGPRRPGPRIWNEQLVRYAGYTRPDGGVTGDPRNAGLTGLALRLGWPGGPGTPFDVLPLVVQGGGDEGPACHDLPDDAVLQVELTHPEYTWWRALGLRWHAVPALANMWLEIGGTPSRWPAPAARASPLPSRVRESRGKSTRSSPIWSRPLVIHCYGRPERHRTERGQRWQNGSEGRSSGRSRRPGAPAS